MKKNLDTPLKYIDGKPLVNEGAILTVKDVVCASLITPPHQCSLEESILRGRLPFRLYKGGVQELSVDELSLIRKAVGETQKPLIIAQVIDWLDSDMEE